MTEFTQESDSKSNKLFIAIEQQQAKIEFHSLAELGPDAEFIEQNKLKQKKNKRKAKSSSAKSTKKAFTSAITITEEAVEEKAAPALAASETTTEVANQATAFINTLVHHLSKEELSEEGQASSHKASIQDQEIAVESKVTEDTQQKASAATTLLGCHFQDLTLQEEPVQEEKKAQPFLMTEERRQELEALHLKEGDICPECHQGVLVKHSGQHADFLGCSHFPQCHFRYFLAKSSGIETLLLMQSKCPQCQKPLAVRKGRFGIFIGCSNYPECSYLYKEQQPQQEKIECPLCHKGILEERRSRQGRTFYGCSTYPQCTFVLSGKPIKQTCPDCGFPVLFIRKLKSGTRLKCGNSLCKFSKKV